MELTINELLLMLSIFYLFGFILAPACAISLSKKFTNRTILKEFNKSDNSIIEALKIARKKYIDLKKQKKPKEEIDFYANECLELRKCLKSNKETKDGIFNK